MSKEENVKLLWKRLLHLNRETGVYYRIICQSQGLHGMQKLKLHPGIFKGIRGWMQNKIHFSLIIIHDTLQKIFYQFSLLILMHISYSSLIQLFQAFEQHYIRHRWGPKMLRLLHVTKRPVL